MNWFGKVLTMACVCIMASIVTASTGTPPQLAQQASENMSIPEIIMSSVSRGELPVSSTRPGVTTLDFNSDCVTCPEGAIQESETCGTNNLNTSCNPSVQYDNISCGQTVCGTVYEFYNNGQNPNFDWDVFQFTLTQQSTVTWCVSSGDAQVHSWLTNAVCGSVILDHSVSLGACEEACATACLPAGTYWAWVNPEDREVANSNGCISYVATLECTPGCTPCINCPAGAITENETCPPPGDDSVNGGCYDGGQFIDVTCNDVVCGSVYFQRSPYVWDMDWYRITITEPTYLKWYLASPNSHVQAWIAQEGSGGCGAPNYDVIYHSAAEDAGICDTICATYCAEPGTYFLVVRPDFEDVNYGRYTIDCAPYTAWIECSSTCPPCVTCPPGATVENEPCPNSAPDLSGCDNFVTVDCGTRYCGKVSGDRGGLPRDEDWIVLNVTEEKHYSICLENDGIMYASLWQYSGSLCNPSWGFRDIRFNHNACDGLCWEFCLTPGNYLIFLSGTYENHLDEGCVNYTLTIDCRECGTEEPEPCTPDPQVLNLDPFADQQSSDCLFLCPEDSTLICVGPGLNETQQPLVFCQPGCFSTRDGNDATVPAGDCDVDCDPTEPVTGDWWFDPSNGSWYRWIWASEATGPGCVCCYFDTILPVELSSFTAIAGNSKVELAWSTASESNNDHFEILRNDEHVADIDAENSPTGSDYTWMDTAVENDRFYLYKLIAVDVSGNREELAVAEASPSAGAATVFEYALHQNFPNPFNPATSITFDVVEASRVTVTVYNSLGQTVATLADGVLEAGRHSVDFDGTNLTSGLYFYRMEAGDFHAVRKMVLMK